MGDYFVDVFPRGKSKVTQSLQIAAVSEQEAATWALEHGYAKPGDRVVVVDPDWPKVRTAYRVGLLAGYPTATKTKAPKRNPSWSGFKRSLSRTGQRLKSAATSLTGKKRYAVVEASRGHVLRRFDRKSDAEAKARAATEGGSAGTRYVVVDTRARGKANPEETRQQRIARHKREWKKTYDLALAYRSSEKEAKRIADEEINELILLEHRTNRENPRGRGITRYPTKAQTVDAIRLLVGERVTGLPTTKIDFDRGTGEHVVREYGAEGYSLRPFTFWFEEIGSPTGGRSMVRVHVPEIGRYAALSPLGTKRPLTGVWKASKTALHKYVKSNPRGQGDYTVRSESGRVLSRHRTMVAAKKAYWAETGRTVYIRNEKDGDVWWGGFWASEPDYAAKVQGTRKNSHFPGKLGTGQRFRECVDEVSRQPGVYDPEGLCASIGRKKYGGKKMARMAREGNPSPGGLVPATLREALDLLNWNYGRGDITRVTRDRRGGRVDVKTTHGVDSFRFTLNGTTVRMHGHQLTFEPGRSKSNPRKQTRRGKASTSTSTTNYTSWVYTKAGKLRKVSNHRTRKAADAKARAAARKAGRQAVVKSGSSKSAKNVYKVAASKAVPTRRSTKTRRSNPRSYYLVGLGATMGVRGGMAEAKRKAKELAREEGEVITIQDDTNTSHWKVYPDGSMKRAGQSNPRRKTATRARKSSGAYYLTNGSNKRITGKSYRTRDQAVSAGRAYIRKKGNRVKVKVWKRG